MNVVAWKKQSRHPLLLSAQTCVPDNPSLAWLFIPPSFFFCPPPLPLFCRYVCIVCCRYLGQGVLAYLFDSAVLSSVFFLPIFILEFVWMFSVRTKQNTEATFVPPSTMGVNKPLRKCGYGHLCSKLIYWCMARRDSMTVFGLCVQNAQDWPTYMYKCWQNNYLQ